METSLMLAVFLMLLYSVIGSIDAIYIHLWKYRLFSFSETRREHVLHTLAILPIMISSFLLLGGNFGGVVLWIAILFSILAFAIQVFDMVEEKKSRRRFDGLPSFEYVIHAVLVGLKFSYTALVLASKPTYAWRLDSPFVLESRYPELVTFIAYQSLAGPVLVFILHLILLHPNFRDFEKISRQPLQS